MQQPSNPETLSPRAKLALFGIGLLALIAGIGVWMSLHSPPSSVQTRPLVTQQATLLPQLKGLPPFSLIDHQGKPFDNDRLLGKWTFLNFGYTHCPDVCPTTLALLADLHSRLHRGESIPAYQIAFVSIDPQRDTPARLAEYVNYFEPSFVGVTGEDAALRDLTQPLGILFQPVETPDSALGYVMDHSTSIILVDPAGRYHALFSPPHDAKGMAADFIAITKRD
jgi:protein SCO1/2